MSERESPAEVQRYTLEFDIEAPAGFEPDPEVLAKMVGKVVARYGARIVGEGHLTPGDIVPAPPEDPAEVARRNKYATFMAREDLFSPEVQKRLETPVIDIVAFENRKRPHVQAALLIQLRNRGIHTARQLLLGGEDHLFNLPGIGDRSRDFLLQAMDSICPEVPLLARCGPEEAARFCASLDQVPAYVLRYGPDAWWVFRPMAGGDNVTVAQLISPGRERYSGDEVKYGAPEAARDFAARFEAARGR